MSRWTHAICRPCWDGNRPGEQPVVMRDADTEPCCLCGRDTNAGIYIRQDPAKTPCMGQGHL